MAVKGKKLYRLYLDQENYELVKKYLDTRRNSGGMSGLMDKHLERCASVVKNSKDILDEIPEGSKLNLKTFFKLLKVQARQQHLSFGDKNSEMF